MEILITLSVNNIRDLDAFVEEQDTCLLLNPEAEIREIRESYPALVKQMQDQHARLPGEVIVKENRPVRLLAVVYDLEQEPVCQLTAVKQTLANLMTVIQKYRLKVVAMPLLGTSYGPVSVDDFLELLQEAISHRPGYPEKLWLVVTPFQYLQVFSFLHMNDPD